MAFNFENNLPHQQHAVDSVIEVFIDLELKRESGTEKQHINPFFVWQNQKQYQRNIQKQQEENKITDCPFSPESIIDIMMETGTGKTYTYTKTIFELNKMYGIFKFIIVVPTLPIKAGTIDFLKSESSRDHFRDQYGKSIKLHIVESQKGSKNKKQSFPQAIREFASSGESEKNYIQVLIINSGMINSETITKEFDTSLFDKYSKPLEVVEMTKSFMIIDEPHKFTQNSKTWENIKKIKPQFILRYGATFPEKETTQKNYLGKNEKIKTKDYHNLIYTLSAVDSFSKNLVKGVIGHISEFENGQNVLIRFVDSSGTDASFELVENRQNKTERKTFKLGKKDEFSKIHSAMSGLFIENLNQSSVILSNGLEMKKGDKINPFSYAQTLQEQMIIKTIRHHLELEKQLLTREIKIKPLTLFFIDNIEEYRKDDGFLKKAFEECLKNEVENLIKTETNEFYKNYLEKTLVDISKTHGGYFAIDKSQKESDKDDDIEKQLDEILHNKQAMLSLENPRRFIFSKWTLREGWDNPNVFQICKLRSSGSDISKLQEVGRGLRLPVNEYGNRVKDEQFYLNYFVDFTENDFVEKLKNEINSKSGAISMEDISDKLHSGMIRQIVEKYQISEEDLLEKLDKEGIIKRNNDFKEGGFEYIKQHYPLIFEGVDSNKIKIAGGENKKKITVRVEKYKELKDLWEKINQKVILEYRVENEAKFQDFFVDFLSQESNFKTNQLVNKTKTITIENNQADFKEQIINGQQIPLSQISNQKYSDFLDKLAKTIFVNKKTLHDSFRQIHTKFNINDYLNEATIRQIQTEFNDYLLANAISKMEISYQKVANTIHPTVLTDPNGVVFTEILDSGAYSKDKVADNYLFNEFFYDSELERQNIQTDIKDVVVFTKIPKNSIKIPVAGGQSYSPDFGYVLNFENGTQKLYFIVETKNVDGEDDLRNTEKQKIKYAEKLFGDTIKIKFTTQFSSDKISTLIQNIHQNSNQI